jgi:hypothetical protein
MICLLCKVNDSNEIYCKKCFELTGEFLGYKKVWKCSCGKIVNCGYNRGVITNHLKICGRPPQSESSKKKRNEKYRIQNQQKIECECGRTITNGSLSKHVKTVTHKDLMKL